MVEIFLSSLRLFTPLMLAACGGLIAERAGIATICLEGILLVSAWAGVVTNFLLGSAWLGLLAAIIAGVLFMLLHAFLSITAKADAIVSGVVVNLLASGLTPVLNKVLFGGPTSTPSLPMNVRLSSWAGLNPLVLLAILVPIALHVALFKTRWGLRLVACGENPEVLITTGVSATRVRYWALAYCGLFTSLGGAYLSMGHAGQFTRDMSAGRGYIALTAVIFSRFKPLPMLGICLFFGMADALQILLQSTSWGGITFPVQWVQTLPYLVTLLVLIGKRA